MPKITSSNVCAIDPFPYADYLSTLRTPASQTVLQRADRETIILLENKNNVLPLNTNIGSIALIGPQVNRVSVSPLVVGLHACKLIKYSSVIMYSSTQPTMLSALLKALDNISQTYLAQLKSTLPRALNFGLTINQASRRLSQRLKIPMPPLLWFVSSEAGATMFSKLCSLGRNVVTRSNFTLDAGHQRHDRRVA
jgi:hypothetical protein